MKPSDKILAKKQEAEQKEIEQKVEERRKNIGATMDKVIEVLKTQNLNVHDSTIVLKTIQEKINLSVYDKMIVDFL